MAEESDRKRWEARYRDRPTKQPETPGWLAQHLVRLPHRGRALDVASGPGRAALALGRHGLCVTAFDVSSIALRRLCQVARQEQLAIHALAIEAQRFSWPPGRFDVVTQFYFLERAIWPLLRESVKSGGWVVVETASVRNLEIGGIGPTRPEWCLRIGELEEVFAGFRIVACREAVLEGPLAVQSIVAQKP